MKPHSDKFKDLVYRFPSLVNFCTVTYITPWSRPDVNAVAKDYITKEMYFEEFTLQKDKLCDVATEIHITAGKTRYEFLIAK